MKKLFFAILLMVSVAQMCEAKEFNDTVRDKNYWKRALLHGKLNLRDTTVSYPKFPKFCINTYLWVDKAFNTYDTTYVVGTGYKWKIHAKNDNWINAYSMHLDGTKISMNSNVTASAGIHLSYMAVTVGYMFDFGKIFGGRPVSESKLEFEFSCARFFANVYRISHSGGTHISRFGDYDGYKVNENFKYDGLKLLTYGADAVYIFNNKHYAHGAAYSFSKIQKKSAGSFIAGLSLSHQDVTIDFSQLPEYMRKYLPSDQTEYIFKYNDYSLIAGYAYNWVFRKNWLFNITLLPSFGFKYCFPVTSTENQYNPSINLNGRIALVRNHNRWYYALHGKVDGKWFFDKKNSFLYTTEDILLTAGYRF